MERMSALDAGFYFLEGDKRPMHVGSVAVFEGPAPAYGDLVRLLMSKLDQVPRYRQRVRVLPLNFGRPVWTDDEHFQILYHVRRTALPAPGGEEELRNLAGRVFAQRLDTARPLWEAWLVEGLEDGRWAIISKVHHCMVDGVAGTDLMALIFDLSPDAEHPVPGDWWPGSRPSPVAMVADALLAAVSEPVKQLSAITVAARAPRTVLTFAAGLPATVRRMAERPVTSLNGPIGPHRRWSWVEADLDEIKTIRQATGGTVNDVVLTAVTGGFRAMLDGRRETVSGRVVRSLVPVSVRAQDEHGLLTNRVAAVFVNLPVGTDDPLERLAAIREQMDELKRTRQALGAEVLTNLAGFAAPTLLALGSRTAFRLPQPLVQAVTTNVPGPRFPLYVLGRVMIRAYPYVPIADRVRVSVGIFSYLRTLSFGITADFDAVPDLEALANGIRQSFDDLAAAAK